jgi:hypothetical protein
MNELEKFAIATRLHVALRRKTGRVTDVEWMIKDAAYADEIMRLSLAHGDLELFDLAEKWELAAGMQRSARMPRRAPSPAPAAQAILVLNVEKRPDAVEERYVGRLR